MIEPKTESGFAATTGGWSKAPTPCWRSARSRTPTDLGLGELGIKESGGFIQVDEHQRTSVPHIYAAGDCTGQLLLSSVAAVQGRKIARHAMGLPVTPIDYSKVSQAIFTEPEIASVGLEEAELAAGGRKVRTTKVPFAANARAVLQGNPRGFVKVMSDPATGVVLGGSIVGHRASELIGIMALAVKARVTVNVLVDTLMVHPSSRKRSAKQRSETSDQTSDIRMSL